MGVVKTEDFHLVFVGRTGCCSSFIYSSKQFNACSVFFWQYEVGFIVTRVCDMSVSMTHFYWRVGD